MVTTKHIHQPFNSPTDPPQVTSLVGHPRPCYTAGSMPSFQKVTGFEERADEELRARAKSFADQAERRRTVRQFSERPVPDQAVVGALGN